MAFAPIAAQEFTAKSASGQWAGKEPSRRFVQQPAGAKPVWIKRPRIGQQATAHSDSKRGVSQAFSVGRKVDAPATQASPASSGTVVLKWKSRRPSTFGQSQISRPQPAVSQPQQIQQQTPAPAGGFPGLEINAADGGVVRAGASQQISPASQPIRRAAQLQQIDPFEDPFGDKTAQNEVRQPAVDGGSQDGASQREPMPLRQPLNNDNTPKLPIDVDPVQPKQPADVSQPPLQPIDPTRQPAPGEPGQRVYNDRDCSSEDGKCKAAREKLKNNPISNIILDITPKTAALPAGAKTARTWKNCRGETLAVGSMTEYRNGRVIIAKEDGGETAILYGDLSDDDLCFVASWRGLPTECRLNDVCLSRGVDQGRDWMGTTFTWKASALCHKPLYFEEVQLERYGHTAGPLKQPIISGAHFFLNIAVLPYKMGINPPNECRYALGYYRPGSCAPWLLDPIPISPRGALMEAGAIVGGVFILP